IKKFSNTITGNSPIPNNNANKTNSNDLYDGSIDDESIDGEAENTENWVISFDSSGQTKKTVENTRDSNISSTQLGNRIIKSAKQKFASQAGSRSGRSTAGGFPRTKDGYAPGTMVYKYEILKLLGRGGMGSVYVAHDTKLGRKVAIKFLSKKISGKKKFRKRFMIEAQATAKLNHENVVTIFDVGEFEGSSYLVLEFLEGSELTKLIKNRKLPMPQVIHYMIPVVRALKIAHDKGIIHRDLKPDNIFVQKDGGVKVLDFGLAKMVDESTTINIDRNQIKKEIAKGKDQGLTKAGAIMGTYAYMSPEQWGMDKVDALSDIWAAGVILFEMLTGEHPLGTRSAQKLANSAAQLDQKVRSIKEVDPTLPNDIADIVSKALAKNKVDRYQSANELLKDLETADPNRQVGRRLSSDETPYPGLSTFQENDADKFFGRDSEIAKFINKLKTNALLAVIGPSGAGKSSFIRAGVIPTIKRQGRKAWDMVTIRPGRDPFAGLAASLLKGGSSTSTTVAIQQEQKLANKLKQEPGQLGTLLRSRSRSTGHPVMLFVDQFEETFTLVSDDDATLFTRALAGAGEDPEVPVRVVVAMRSDFLDRVAEYEQLMESLTKDVTILQSPGPAGLFEAITKPASLMGYSFEDPQMVKDMVDSLKDEPAALPLLQFTASKLWDNRDQTRKLLTRDVYEDMGGVGGALARHADSILQGMTTNDQRAVKRLFQRLVTPDGTRAVITVSEISSFMGTDIAARILKTLASARLLTISSIGEHGEDAQVEVVHESLIQRWQTLKRWLEEDNENAAMLQQLRDAAKQWDRRGRPNGLLWTGDALDEARLWLKRYNGGLTSLEKTYLDKAFWLANRSERRKKYLIAAAIIIMAFVTIFATAALFAIRGAEQTARKEAKRAKSEAKRASIAEKNVKKKMELLAKETEKAKSAEALASKRLKEAVEARKKQELAQKNLEKSNKDLQVAFKEAKEEKKRAEQATRRARRAAYMVKQSAKSERKARLAAEQARKELKVLLEKERETVKRLQALRSRIIQELPRKAKN
ncbi:MAG: protein kinase, partial [Deltaproteobacteria bacterium]|nr:protein kinase [Deltaproteobacteria bacterium]